MRTTRIIAVVLVGTLLARWTAVSVEPWTLERALRQALEGNPEARLAQQRIAGSRALLEQANAAFWPRLGFQSSYTRTDNPMLVFGSILNQRAYSSSLNFNDVPDVDNLNVKGSVTMPLYQGGRTRAGRESAKAGTEAARLDELAVRNALAFEVVRAFHTVAKAREFIRAADAAVNSYQTNIAVAQRRLEAGTLLRNDVLDLEVRLAQAREDQVRARNSLALSERSLRNLLGIETGEFAVAEEVPEVKAPEQGDHTTRAELGAAAQRVTAAEQQVRAARGAYLPSLSAFGSLDYDYGWKYREDGASYVAGAMLQLDIWNGNLTRGRVNEAKANLESAREAQRKTRLALGLEAEQARLDLAAASERLRVTEQAVETAAESAGLARARFEQGQALATQLMDAETMLVAARVRRAEAQADRRIAIAALRKALALNQIDAP